MNDIVDHQNHFMLLMPTLRIKLSVIADHYQMQRVSCICSSHFFYQNFFGCLCKIFIKGNCFKIGSSFSSATFFKFSLLAWCLQRDEKSNCKKKFQCIF